MKDRPNRYPFPIELNLQQVKEASDPIARFIQLGNLFEVTLRYLATLTLGTLLQIRRDRQIGVPPRVLAGLMRPSLGHWCQVLRAIPPRLAEAGPLPVPELVTLTQAVEQPENMVQSYREIHNFLGKKRESVPRRLSIGAFLDLHVAFRNKTKAHGAIQGAMAELLNPVLDASLKGILESLSFLRNHELGVEEFEERNGKREVKPISRPAEPGPKRGKLWLLDQSGKPLIPLFPAAAWENDDFWFLNGWADPQKVEFLSYSTGRIRVEACPEIQSLLEPPHEGGSLPFAQSLQWDMFHQDVWNIPADVAIMAQDRQRVFGPLQEVCPEALDQPKIGQLLAELDQSNPSEKLGEVILSRRSWCTARFLLEAVVYDLDQAVITDRESLRSALEKAFRQAGELGAETIALSPLGAEYGVIGVDEFSDILVRALEQQAGNLRTLSRLVITPREAAQLKPLQEALARRLGVSIGLLNLEPLP